MKPVYLQGRGLVSVLGADLPQALACLSAGSKAPQRITLPDGTHWPYFSIDHPEPDWRKRAQQIIRAAIREAGAESCRNAPLFVASSSLDIGAIETKSFIRCGEPTIRGGPDFDAETAPLVSSEIEQSKLPDGRDYYDFAEQIAGWLDWTGPIYVVASACTSSLQAILFASRLIGSGSVNDAIVLGIELTNRLSVSGFAAMQLLTSSAPKPLGSGRDGIALGEAVSVIHLSSRNARWRLCGGSHITDGRDPTGAIPQTVALMCKQALAAGGLEPHDIGLIKLQAAGSPVNDVNELSGLQAVFDPLPPLTTLKAALGHTLGASGAAEIVLLTACLETNTWPQPDYLLDSDLPAGLEYARPESIQYLLAGILGFGGGHAAVILEDTHAR